MVDAIITVVDYFGFDNWNKTGRLTGAGILSKNATVFGDGVISGSKNVALFVEMDFKGSAPFGETKT